MVILFVVAAPRLFSGARLQTWIELRSPNFIVVTNANEKQARRVAYQFEMVRAVFREYFGISGSANDQPVIIIAAKDEDTLKTLLPEYWATKGSLHPAGIYLGGPEKNYVGLRLDVSMDQSGSEPYELVYHEYVHYLTRRLMSRMPLWLVEGLAEFYGNIRIEGKVVYLGAPSASNLMILHQTPPLKLSALFDVTASSPYYHEQNKASIFYAESWALTHYLMARDWREKTHRVNDFVDLLGKNVPQAEAAGRTIGGPEALGGALSQYVHNYTFSAARLNAPAIDESDFRAQPLSDAESLAVRADFIAYDRHYAEAQAMLEEALKLDPKLAAACESMGFLYFQQGKTAEAGRWYSEAVALNSQSYFANFYYAVNLLKGGLDDDSAAKAESSLRAAIKINPAFAPAYNALAYVLAMASPSQNPDEAYMMVLHAVELEPGNVSYRIRAVQVLERLGRAEDAVSVANLAVSLARTPQEQAEASATLSSAQQFEAYHNRAEEFRKAQASVEPSGQTTQTPAPNVGASRGGAFKVGGGVSPPRAVFAPDPEYSEEARKAKYQGTCVLWVVIGPDGRVRDLRVARTLGLGLDEKAMEAVKTWKFEPAMKDGKPVAVQINIEITFRLYNDLDVSPTSAQLVTGAKQQFSATVSGATNSAVNWSVGGPGCAASACGSISADGLYTAPLGVPNPASVIVKATSATDPTKMGLATVTIQPSPSQ
jgi:TonB family protein